MKDYPMIISSIVHLYIAFNLVNQINVEESSLSHLTYDDGSNRRRQ